MKTAFLAWILMPFACFAMQDTGIQQQVQERVETFYSDHAVVGLVAIAIGKEEFEHVVTLGHLSLKSSLPVNLYTEFRLGPLTELFTAAILAYFVQEGQVSLKDPVSKFLPKSMKVSTYKGKQITLGDLATHTSGLPDMPYTLTSRSSFSASQMYRFLSKYELTREPGTRYEYSTFGYAFLASLLSRIAKCSFPDLIEKVITHPLGLRETTFSPSYEQRKRLATGYEQGKGISPLTSEKIYSIFIGSGGLYSTAHDMRKFLSFNMGKEKTSLKGILSLMQTPYHSFGNAQVGLAWKVSTLGKEKLLFLGGTLFGFGVYLGITPGTETGVMILTTQGDYDPSILGEELLMIMNGHLSF